MNILIVHGGGPTPVINSSLYGIIQEAKRHQIDHIYGVRGGTQGVLEEWFVPFERYSDAALRLLLGTPASVIGTSRTPLYDNDFDRMIDICRRHDISIVIVNGGNGTMDACGKLTRAAEGTGIRVMGVPKTVDNDIAVTDHCPGYGSAARYIAGSVRELGMDIRSMPIHVSIVEAMGRNTGWITAASVLARRKEGDAPHLIYLPERPFCADEFLTDVERVHREKGGVVVVASEGLKDEKGNQIVEPIYTTGRAVYFGDVGTHLAALVVKELGIKARSEKPGIFGRSSIQWQSPVDRNEAVRLGELAVQAAMEGKSGYMTGLKRTSEEPYQCEGILIPIADVMLYEKELSLDYINERGNDVTTDFIRYARPLIGGDLPVYFEISEESI